MLCAVSTTPWQIPVLGPATVPSPLHLSTDPNDDVPDYVRDDARVLHDAVFTTTTSPDLSRAFEVAGPREKIFFDPARTTAAIVTAGGLCPGINNVIRSVVLHAFHKYGVRRILGFRYGFAGLDAAEGLAPIALGPEDVRHIHNRGGTLLGTARGEHDVGAMVDTLERERVDILFVVGGDGTMKGAAALSAEAARRGRSIAVVGIPKTIDNDIEYVDKTFGFDTAVTMAKLAIDAAHTEASSARRGIGLVRLMGREAGFVAAHATLASRDVNVCLVPEVPFAIEGQGGLLAFLEWRLEHRGHAVVVVAEGCGKHLARGESARDASGNLQLSHASLDVGRHLQKAITAHFEARGLPCVLKYIDPSYMVRGVPAAATDAVFCDELARNAVHAAMAGKTAMMVGRSRGVFTHVPLAIVNAAHRRIDPDKSLWLAVTETTGQPSFSGVGHGHGHGHGHGGASAPAGARS
jgi:6-phosphofructokinase 1